MLAAPAPAPQHRARLWLPLPGSLPLRLVPAAAAASSPAGAAGRARPALEGPPQTAAPCPLLPRWPPGWPSFCPGAPHPPAAAGAVPGAATAGASDHGRTGTAAAAACQAPAAGHMWGEGVGRRFCSKREGCKRGWQGGKRVTSTAASGRCCASLPACAPPHLQSKRHHAAALVNNLLRGVPRQALRQMHAPQLVALWVMGMGAGQRSTACMRMHQPPLAGIGSAGETNANPCLTAASSLAGKLGAVIAKLLSAASLAPIAPSSCAASPVSCSDQKRYLRGGCCCGGSSSGSSPASAASPPASGCCSNPLHLSLHCLPVRPLPTSAATATQLIRPPRLQPWGQDRASVHRQQQASALALRQSTCATPCRT